MLDIFGGGVTAEQLNQSNQVHGVNSLALMIALTEKGILTEDEIEAARLRATHLVEQSFAERRNEMMKEFDEKHPGVRDLMGKLFGSNK